MNDEMKNTNPNDIEKKLLDVAGRTHADPHFVSELESKLKATHKPKTSWSMPMFKQATSALGWIALVAVLGYFLNWSFATLIPTQQPGANITPNQFICPVTEPNGSTPPLEQPSTYHHGNGDIWTDLWPAGKIFMQPDNREADGSFSMKWVWWRNVTGALEIEGRRLDANAEPLRVFYTGGYDDSGVYVVALIFPTTGCWEVTGRVGESSLTFVTEVIFGEATATPDVSTTQDISTPDSNRAGFDFRNAKLVLNTTLPESPAEAKIYSLLSLQPATAEYAEALAKQFGIAGELYHSQRDYPITSGFMVTDGKQQLIVFGENDYIYIADLVTYSRNSSGFENADAETIILNYLQSHGLDSRFNDIEASPTYGGYVLQQIAPDGLPMQYESFSQPTMRITLAEDGSILSVRTTPMLYDPNPLGTYEIISAEAALQKVLDDTLPAGKLETSHSGMIFDTEPPQTWYHEYPDNQTVALVGNVQAREAVDTNKPAVIFLDNVQVIGNTSGLEAFQTLTLIQATGQYVVENSLRKFNVDSWTQDVQPASMTGFARREGEQIIFVNGDGSGTEYALVDPPADLPLDTSFPASSLISDGALVDGKLYWMSLVYFADSSQMGGGGGGGSSGIGFYQLNLSGNPIPFPTVAPTEAASYTAAEIASFLKYEVQANDTLSSIAVNFNVSTEELMRVNNLPNEVIYLGTQLVIPGVPGPTRVDGERGTVMVTIYQKPDGRLRTQYGFLSEKDLTYYELKGDNLEPLQELANRPIRVSGALSYDNFGSAFIHVETFEELYPGLEYQALTGTQTTQDVNGEQLVLFTTDGTTYVQLALSGGYADGNFVAEKTEVLVRGLLVPGETYAGYPALRVTVIGPAVNPVTGEKSTLDSIADSLQPYPDPFGNADSYIPPDIIIDKVELIYFVNQPTPGQPLTESYIQPVWSFEGHDTNGNILNILIQALQQKFLSPDITPRTPLG